MKHKVVFIILLLVALAAVFFQKNQTFHNSLLHIINPIKSGYRKVTQMVEDKSNSYIFQKESIAKLTKENRILKKYLLDQTQYLQQVDILFKKLPTLEKLPYKSIALVETISYTKLNSFNKILLTNPKKMKLEEDKAYGLIQNNSVGGTAIYKKGNLYGYLSSNPRCKFAIFIGKNRTPGIVQGLNADTMMIKYIPKWANIKKGDRVETSGLDGIFFANIPVGTIKSIHVGDSYKTAYVKTFADNAHPDIYFLITDAKPRLVSYYEQNSSFPGEKYQVKIGNENQKDQNITSIPKTLQTKESEVDLSEFEIPKEPSGNNKSSQAQKQENSSKKLPKKIKKPTTFKKMKKINIQNSIKPASEPTNIALPAEKKPQKKRRNPLDIFK